MKILNKIERSPEQLFLVNTFNKGLIIEAKNLIDKRKYEKAITLLLCKARIVNKAQTESHDCHADLILTEYNARWDLTLIK